MLQENFASCGFVFLLPLACEKSSTLGAQTAFVDGRGVITRFTSHGPRNGSAWTRASTTARNSSARSPPRSARRRTPEMDVDDRERPVGRAYPRPATLDQPAKES